MAAFYHQRYSVLDSPVSANRLDTCPAAALELASAHIVCCGSIACADIASAQPVEVAASLKHVGKLCRQTALLLACGLGSKGSKASSPASLAKWGRGLPWQQCCVVSDTILCMHHVWSRQVTEAW